MSDTNPTAPIEPKPTDPASAGDPQNDADVDWHSRFEAQRKVNRDLEAKFETRLRETQAAQNEALAKALGLKPEQASDVQALANTVAALQQQWTEAQHDNAAMTVAAQHGITAQSDIDTLRAIKDEATMRSVAARFAASAAAESGRPKPDLTQGAQGTPAGGTPEQDFANFLGSALNR